MKKPSSILRHRGKNYSLTDILDTLRKHKNSIDLLPVERQILECRVEGVSLCEMDQSELLLATDAILISGGAITGCALPNTEFFAEKIGDEIRIFVCDFGYSELTLSEILLSMRINSANTTFPGCEITPVPFTGHCFNTTFLAKVLANYKEIRTMLDRKLQNLIDGFV